MTDVHQFLRKFKDAWLLLQVHDELVVECNDGDAETIRDGVKRIIETCTDPYIKWKLPIKSKGGIGQTWGESK